MYGISFAPLEKNNDLKALGVAGISFPLSFLFFSSLFFSLILYLFPSCKIDSKTLDEEQREDLFAKIKSTPWLGWMVHILSPTDISAGMLGR